MGRLWGVYRPLVTRGMVGLTFELLLAKNWPPGVPPFQPGAPRAGDARATVVVNHGQWVAHCPYCPGAQIADPDDHRFFCVDCLNQHADGRVIYARWPKNHAKIAEHLERRPRVETRNWNPMETLSDLLAENIEHGLVKA